MAKAKTEVPKPMINFIVKTFDRTTGETQEHIVPAESGLLAIRQLSDTYADLYPRAHQSMEIHGISRV